jgi:hypothetical protein
MQNSTPTLQDIEKLRSQGKLTPIDLKDPNWLVKFNEIVKQSSKN